MQQRNNSPILFQGIFHKQSILVYVDRGILRHVHVKPCSTCQSKVTQNSHHPPPCQKSNNNTLNETTVFTLFDTVKSALTDCYRAISCFIKTI